jgi:hypothetical protein
VARHILVDDCGGSSGFQLGVYQHSMALSTVARRPRLRPQAALDLA